MWSSLLLVPAPDKPPLAEMVMMGSGAGIGRGTPWRRPALPGLVVVSRVGDVALVAERRLRFDFTVVLRDRIELWFLGGASSSEKRDLTIFSPIGGPGVAETARGCTGAFARVRGLGMVGTE